MIKLPFRNISYNYNPKKRVNMNDSVELELKELTKLIDEKRKSQGKYI